MFRVYQGLGFRERRVELNLRRAHSSKWHQPGTTVKLLHAPVELQDPVTTHRLHGSSFLGLPYRIP